MTRSQLLYAVLAITGALAGCKKDEPAVVDLGYDYFPQNIGHWIEYHVDSMRVQLDNSIDGFDTINYSYALREVIAENITDGEGKPAQRIIRYTQVNGEWLPKDVWWQTRDNVRAERNEENKLRVKLIFPPRDGAEWDTNAPNTDEEFGLTYNAIDEAYSVNGLNFDKTVNVVGTFESNLIEQRTYEERYAKGVGMVVHTVDSIDRQFSQIFPDTVYTLYNRWFVKYAITGYGN